MRKISQNYFIFNMVLRMVFLKNFNEDHEIDVADKYFTGVGKKISKVKPFAITKILEV